MSGFLGGASVDNRIQSEMGDWGGDGTIRKSLNVRNFLKIAGPRASPAEYTNAFWPGHMFFGAQGNDFGLMEGDSFDLPELTSGGASRYGIAGITLDAYGAVLGGYSMKLFYTGINTFALPADTLVATTTSDPNTGYFLLTTPYYPDAHYIVYYLAGSPDRYHTTVNTLIAS